MNIKTNNYKKLLKDIELAGGISNVNSIQMTLTEWEQLLKDGPNNIVIKNGAEKSYMDIPIIITPEILHG